MRRQAPFACLRHWLGAIVLCVCAGSAVAADPEPADRLGAIRERGVLIAGVKEDYAPFGFRDATGALVGYDVDVARALAEAIGVTLRPVPVTSANRLQALERGEVDILVATLGDTRSRRAPVTIVRPQRYRDARPDKRGAGTGRDSRGETRGM